MRRPSSAYTRQAAATRSPGALASGVVPATIHSPRVRACSERKRCTGPSPSASAIARLSASRRPMNEKFSGSTATRAPASRACLSSVAAVARLASNSLPAVICSAATVTACAVLISIPPPWHARRIEQLRRLEQRQSHHARIAALQVLHKYRAKPLDGIGPGLVGGLAARPVAARLGNRDGAQSHTAARQQ